MKLSKIILTGCLAIAINASAQASVVWNLNDFFFGTQAVTGQFEWDGNTNTVLDWSINTGAYSNNPEIYDPSQGTSYLLGTQTIIFSDNTSNWQFRIGVGDLNLLDTAGGTISLMPNLVGGGSAVFLECKNCAPYRLGDTGAFLSSSVISPVPEPSSIILMLGSLGLIGFIAARRSKKA